MGFVDLHSHVLPALDDGSPDAATSLAMISGLAAIGFDVICATPHQKAGQFMPSLDSVHAAHAATADAVSGRGLPVRLALGAENMWDATFYERCESLTMPSYDGGPAFLFELPTAQMPVGVLERLFALRSKGRLPVLAHPERYEALHSQPALIEKLRENCALVVDLGAVAGYHGRKATKLSRRLIEDGIAHAAASDAHTKDDVRLAAEGIAWIRKKVGEARMHELLDRAPRAILAGAHPDE